MLKYDPCSKCVKCGNLQAATCYMTRTANAVAPVMEYIERTCHRCGYKWHEACLDAGKDSETELRSKIRQLEKEKQTMVETWNLRGEQAG